MNPRMSVHEVMAEMRKRGMAISQYVLADGIEQGMFPFGQVVRKGPTGKRCFLILRKDFESWAQEHLA